MPKFPDLRYDIVYPPATAEDIDSKIEKAAIMVVMTMADERPTTSRRQAVSDALLQQKLVSPIIGLRDAMDLEITRLKEIENGQNF